jgi:hypothetical protein
MSALFFSGRIVDLIILLMVAEAAALVAYRRASRAGPRFAVLLPNFLAGMFLLLALRAALTDAWWGWMAAALAGSLLAHLADLRSRWRA